MSTAPSLWSTRPLREVATLQRGFDLPTRLRKLGDVPIVSSSGVSGLHHRSMVRGPGVVTGRYGTIGEVFYVEDDFWPLNTTLWVSNFHGNDVRFIYYLLHELDFASHSGKSGVPGVNRNDLHQLEVCLPTGHAAQRQIAEVLTDIDRQITVLDRVIAKKEAIKQGMMQQLLTGETRLPGFTGAWKEWSMRSLGKPYGGLVGKTKEDFGVGEARYVPFMAVMARVRVTGQSLLRVRVGSAERQNVIKNDDLLFNTSSETPDELAMCAVATDLPADTYLNSFCFGFRLYSADTADSLFLAYLFRSEAGRQLMKTYAQGAIRYNLSRAQFRNVVVVLPPIDEQRAIAGVLNDIDSVIGALQDVHAKAKSIKQGIMQELLTGRTRLPVVEDATV